MAVNINGTRVPTYDEMTKEMTNEINKVHITPTTWLAYTTKSDSGSEFSLEFTELLPAPTDSNVPKVGEAVLLRIGSNVYSCTISEVQSQAIKVTRGKTLMTEPYTGDLARIQKLDGYDDYVSVSNYLIRSGGVVVIAIWNYNRDTYIGTTTFYLDEYSVSHGNRTVRVGNNVEVTLTFSTVTAQTRIQVAQSQQTTYTVYGGILLY